MASRTAGLWSLDSDFLGHGSEHSSRIATRADACPAQPLAQRGNGCYLCGPQANHHPASLLTTKQGERKGEGQDRAPRGESGYTIRASRGTHKRVNLSSTNRVPQWRTVWVWGARVLWVLVSSLIYFGGGVKLNNTFQLDLEGVDGCIRGNEGQNQDTLGVLFGLQAA